MIIKQNLVNENKYDIKCPYEMEPQFIIVHNTANDASAENEIKYMITNNKKVSFHYAIDDGNVVQGIPENRNSWNAGDGMNGNGNRKGISIEICYSKSGGEKFENAEKNAAKFIAMKLKERCWEIDNVKKHQDFSNKYCPHRTLDLGWDRFLNIIKEYLDDSTINNIERVSDEQVRVYQNGSTSENVYADTNCTIKIGSLNPREKCDCFGVFNNKAMVRYSVSGTNNFKMGFCKWLGGVQ